MEKIAEMFTQLSTQITSVDSKVDNLDSKVGNLEVTLRSEMAGGFAEVNRSLSELRRDLDIVEQTAESSRGFSKEIDMIMDAVRKINKHLGLESTF